jgi:hypothetical protein
MRRLPILCAATTLAVTAFVAASSAQAGYHLIRWEGNGFCQIWDEAIPTMPHSSNYTTVMRSAAPTFVEALATKERLLRAGACSL